MCEDETGIEHASVLDSFTTDGVDGGDEDFLLNDFHQRCVNKGRGAIGAHATSVRAGVTLT